MVARVVATAARRRRALAALACGAVLALGGPATAERVIALTPLATLGNADTSASAMAITGQLEAALAAQPDTKLVGAAQVAQAVRRAKRPGLAVCDGDAECLASLGGLVGATVIVTGQSGGLADARVIYLSATDAATGKELGSTTWTTGGTDSAAAAVARLLAPASYTGTLELALGGVRAAVYIDGNKLPSEESSYTLPVGTHALRVNHPEFRDFVRFVDIGYRETTKIDVALQRLPVVQRDLEARGRDGVGGGRRPWTRRWWVVAGGAVVIAVLAGTVAYYQADGFDPDVTLP